MLRLSPAGYEPHPELCVVATYFNALGYQTPRANFLRFLEPLLKGKTQLVVVEGLHDGVVGLPSALRERVRWVGVPCEGGLWQKERLVNVAIEHVPAACTVIAWLDGDILFSDPRWMPKTVEANVANSSTAAKWEGLNIRASSRYGCCVRRQRQ